MPAVTRASFLGFAAFGLFWGAWGGTLPALRDQAALTDAQFGTALVFIGLGALPVMLFSGHAVDRWGPRVAGFFLITLAGAAAVVGALAHDLLSASICMLLLGAASGGADVGINSVAGLAEHASGSRIISRSHGVFSAFVVAGSLAAGGLRALAVPTVAIFVAVAVLIGLAGLGVAVLVWRREPVAAAIDPLTRSGPGLRWLLPFAVIGLVGALAFAVENAHQSWSAVFLTDEIHSPAAITALAPATFAAFASITRFASSYSRRVPASALLLGGAVAAVIGTLLLASSQSVPVALVGLAIAAIGTSVLFPTLLSVATNGVEASKRGRATSAVGTIAYLGFLVGPAYVGLLAGEFGLRGAMVGVAALAVAFALLCLAVTSRRPSRR